MLPIAKNCGILVLLVSMLAIPSGSRASDLSPVELGPPATLSLPDLNCRERSLDEFAGQILLVNFWASWCTPCITEMPSIQRLAERMSSSSFRAIGVNVGEARRRVQTVAGRLGIEFPVLLDTQSVVFNRWGAEVLPSTYILDTEHRVRYVGRGPREWDSREVTDLLTRLREESRKPSDKAPPERERHAE